MNGNLFKVIPLFHILKVILNKENVQTLSLAKCINIRIGDCFAI